MLKLLATRAELLLFKWCLSCDTRCCGGNLNPLLLLLLQAAAALLRAHSPEAMKLRANGIPIPMSATYSLEIGHWEMLVWQYVCTLLCP